MQQIKINTLKIKYILAFLLLFVGQTKAQNIVPIEKHIDYIGGGKGIVTNTYFKDVNHLMDPLIGTWQGSMDNKTYTFYVTKKTTQGRTNSFDELEVRHYIVDNSTGVILEDTRNTSRIYIKGDCFRKEDPSDYMLNYLGDNSRCGNKGWIRLKSVSPTTMRFIYTLNPLDLRRKDECPGSCGFLLKKSYNTGFWTTTVI
nr:hypothetical protein [uncultured Flavobacterium sp.]